MVSVVPGEHSVAVEWTNPTHSDGVPVIGYSLRLYERTSPIFAREWGTDDPSLWTLVAQREFAANERSHVFEDLDPSRSFAIELDLRNRFGRTMVTSDHFRVRTSANTIRVTDVGPYGFTLSWNPEDGTRYLSGFDDSYLIAGQRTAYGPSNLIGRDSVRPDIFMSYQVRDESDSSYYTIDPSQHPQGNLGVFSDFSQHPQSQLALSSSVWGAAFTEMHRRSSFSSFRDDQPHWDTFSNWYVRSDWNGTSFRFDQGVRPDTTYTVRIIACRDGGDVIWPDSCHNYATVTVTTPPTTALSPPDEIVVTAGNTWVELAWNQVPGAETYAICGFGPHCHHLSTTLHPDFPVEYSIMDLEPETTYTIEVKSCLKADSVGASYAELGSDFLCGSPVSSSVTTTTSQSGVAPGRPGLVTATSGDTWVKLEWDEVPDAEEYRVTRYKPDGRVDSVVGMYVSDDRPANWIRYHSLQPETNYDFELQACRTVGSTNACGDPRAVSVTTASEPDTRPSPPDPPTGFTVVGISDAWVDAEWDPVPDVEQYRRSVNGNPYAYGDYDPANLRSQDPRGSYFNLNPNTTYTIGVSVCKIVGVSFVCSADATLTVTTKAQ